MREQLHAAQQNSVSSCTATSRPPGPSCQPNPVPESGSRSATQRGFAVVSDGAFEVPVGETSFAPGSSGGGDGAPRIQSRSSSCSGGGAARPHCSVTRQQIPPSRSLGEPAGAAHAGGSTSRPSMVRAFAARARVSALSAVSTHLALASYDLPYEPAGRMRDTALDLPALPADLASLRPAS
jgi:hypothetical protein